MECPMCSALMRIVIEPNGKVFWACGSCDFRVETEALAPDPTDNYDPYFEDWRKDENKV